MMVTRVPAASSNMLDVLERVLDRGIVIDAWVGVSVAGIRVLELDTRIDVASLDTYLSRASEVSIVTTANRPASLVRPAVPSDSVPESALSPSRRRRPRRRRLRAQPTEAAPPTAQLRCEKGCTFAWTKAGDPPTSMACPYRKRARCRVIAA